MRTPCLLLLAAALSARAEGPVAPSVVLPLDRYQELASRETPRSLTIVEAARLEGSFQKGVFLVLSGRSMGTLPPVDVLQGAGLRLSDCGSDALLSRGDQGEVLLTPLKPRFTLRCALGRPAADKVSVVVHRVLDVAGVLSDGTVEVSEGERGERTLVATPVPEETRAAATGAALRPTAVGRYRVTIFPDDTRFRWQLSVHNPNRICAPFVLTLRPGESVGQVTSPSPYESGKGTLRFEIPPGNVELAVTGTTKDADFTPPFEAAAHYLLVESHPLFRAEVATSGQRISLAEVGIASQFRGGQGFLLMPGQKATWAATRLETLPSTSYAVSSLRSWFFVGADGQAVGQSDLVLTNQGATELSVPLRAVPTYAAIEDVPTVLTKDKQGNLWFPLGAGQQSITVQHKQTLPTALGFAAGALELPGVGGVANLAGVELRYGSDWTPLFQSFAGEHRFALPEFVDVFLLLLLGLWAERLLSALGMPRRRRLAFAVMTAVVAGANGAYWVVVFALAAGSMLWLLSWLRDLPRGSVLPAPSTLVGVVTTVVLGALLIVGVTTVFGDNVRRLYGMSADALAGGVGPHPGRMGADLDAALVATGTYRGLPARFEVPAGAQRSDFSRELVDTGGPSSVRVLLVSVYWVSGLRALLTLALLVLAYLSRELFVAGANRQLGKLLAPRFLVENRGLEATAPTPPLGR